MVSRSKDGHGSSASSIPGEADGLQAIYYARAEGMNRGTETICFGNGECRRMGTENVCLKIHTPVWLGFIGLIG